jgi:uncharacterized protein YbjQ (UPF0145 family)
VFVSRLSVNEFVLAPGLTVLGVVGGSVVYHAREEECPESSRAMKGMTRDRTQVLRTAYDRLAAQAKRLGASGVVGIRITHREIAEDVWEHTVQGTAVGGCASGAGGRPFTCTLTGQEYFALTATGYRPVGVALGVCVYYQKFHQKVQQQITGSGQNVERSDFTRGLYTARRNALTTLEAEAAALGAAGVLGMSVSTKRTLNRKGRTSQGMMIEFTALGTAVIAAGNDTLAIDYALPLSK